MDTRKGIVPLRFRLPLDPPIQLLGIMCRTMKTPSTWSDLNPTMLDLYRQKSPPELTDMASRMFAGARDRLKAYLRELHPDWSEEQLKRELLERIHGTK